MSNNNTANILVAALGTAVTGVLLYNSIKSTDKVENFDNGNKVENFQRTQPTPGWNTFTGNYYTNDNFPTRAMRGPPGTNQNVKDKTIDYKSVSEQEKPETPAEQELKSYSKTHYGALERERQAYQSWDRVLQNDTDLLLDVFRGGKQKVDANIVATGSMHTGAYHRQFAVNKEMDKNASRNSLRPTVGRFPTRFHYEPSGTALFDVATRAIDSNPEDIIKKEIKNGNKATFKQFGGPASLLYNIRKQNLKKE